MGKFKIRDKVFVKKDYKDISTELDRHTENQPVGISPDIIDNLDLDYEVKYEIFDFDEDGDVIIREIGEKNPHHHFVVYADVLEFIEGVGVFVVTSLLYDEFNSVDHGLYFDSKSKAKEWVESKIGDFPLELHNISEEDIVISELKCF